jgi:zinc transport system substrate-binding protein
LAEYVQPQGKEMTPRCAALFALLCLTGVARAEVPNVVASIAPIHSLVASVMQGVGEPELLIPANVSEHDYALRPSDVGTIAGADLVVWVGESLESYLVRPLETEGVANLELIDAGGVEPQPYGHVPEHDDLPAQEHEAVHEAEGSHDHHHLALDPHIWMDPVRAEAIVNAVAERLAEVDPPNADRYRANSADTTAELAALDREIRDRLAPVAEKPFITFHDGYSYFVERYGLNQVGQLAMHPEARPGAATVAALRDMVAAEGVTCAFAEPQFQAGALQRLVSSAAITIATLDTLGAGLEPGPELYATLLQKNAKAVEECLSSGS